MTGNTTQDATSRRVTRVFVVAIVAYVIVVLVGTRLLDESSPTWLGAVIAGVAAVPALVGLLFGAVNYTRREGVERDVLFRSTSIGFFATMAAALTYGLLESFADMPALSGWVFYSVGMATWLVATLVLQRRLSA